uniref:Anaphase-promoting complex subunit 4 WD40 domain-containing protein n=1 Tax=Aureoumbra lagunensis TaxID=44058 RepID=A0A7S3K5V2_9STRA
MAHSNKALFGPFENWQTVKRIEKAHDAAIWTVAWTAQEKIISGSNDECVSIRGRDDMGITHRFEGHRLGVLSVDTDAAGSILAVASIDCVIRFYDLDKGISTGEIRAGPVESWTVSINNDASLVASGSHQGTVNIWSLKRNGNEYLQVARLACGANEFNNYIQGGLDDEAYIEAAKMKKSQSTINSKIYVPPQPNFAMDVAFSPDGKWLAASGIDGIISIFDVETQKRVSILKGHHQPVRKITFSPDSSRLLSACDDSRLLAFDFAREEHFIDQYSAHTGWVMSCQYAPDGSNRFASCSGDGTVKIWDTAVSGGHVLASLEEHESMVSSLAFSPDAKKLITGAEDGCLQMHSLLPGEKPQLPPDPDSKFHLEPVSFAQIEDSLENVCNTLATMIIPPDEIIDEEPETTQPPEVSVSKRYKSEDSPPHQEQPMDLTSDNHEPSAAAISSPPPS